MKSKKQLFKDLVKIDKKQFLGAKLGHDKIEDETYGRKSMIYACWDSLKDRKVGEVKLEKLGHVINKDYSIEFSTSEIQVNYFEGNNWDE